MTERQIQEVLKYKMTEKEAIAYCICCFYVEAVKKYFPDYRFNLPNLTKDGCSKSKDPRRTALFRAAWKMMDITKGKLRQDEYRDYVEAQMSILHNITVDGVPPFVDYLVLHGNKDTLKDNYAWARWLVWKKYINNHRAVIYAENNDSLRDIKKKLVDTHCALKVRLGDVTVENLWTALENGQVFRLAKLNAISPYFLALSPTVQRFLAAKPQKLDLSKYKEVDKGVIEAYKSIFDTV